LRALVGLPEIEPGCDLGGLLRSALLKCFESGAPGADGGRPGVLVVAQKVVSKAEGRLVHLSEVNPSPRAERLARYVDKDARLVELILRESRRVVRAVRGVLICETHHGLICANAGIDQSNAPGEDCVILLPEDPDTSARRIKSSLWNQAAVIVTDTFGRPWRDGLVDVAIGVAGMHAMRSEIGELDRSGRELRVTVHALADQLAAAAGMLMTKQSGQPAIWIEGIEFTPSADGHHGQLLRDPERDLFR